MKIVTLKTAKRLKAAGFPQPEYSSLEKWYVDGAIENGGKIERYFAPDAIDILKYINGATLAYQETFQETTFWTCVIDLNWLFISMYDKNPAEAAAKAWIEFNAKAEPK
jgi:hypothetical protein